MTTRGRFHFDEVNRDSLLLVEGNDDARFFAAFLKSLRNGNSVQIAMVGGKDNFRPFITETLIRAPGYSRLRKLGLVRDADSSAQSAFQSLADSLRAANLPAPSQPWEAVPQGQLTVSVGILPDGTSEGDLETLCLNSIGDNAALQCGNEYLRCMEQTRVALGHRNKARLHTFLATGDDPGLRIGEAADAGVWDWTSPSLRQVSDFLKSF